MGPRDAVLPLRETARRYVALQKDPRRPINVQRDLAKPRSACRTARRFVAEKPWDASCRTEGPRDAMLLEAHWLYRPARSSLPRSKDDNISATFNANNVAIKVENIDHEQVCRPTCPVMTPKVGIERKSIGQWTVRGKVTRQRTYKIILPLQFLKCTFVWDDPCQKVVLVQQMLCHPSVRMKSRLFSHWLIALWSVYDNEDDHCLSSTSSDSFVMFFVQYFLLASDFCRLSCI